jgi:hypothetical protein
MRIIWVLCYWISITEQANCCIFAIGIVGALPTKYFQQCTLKMKQNLHLMMFRLMILILPTFKVTVMHTTLAIAASYATISCNE